MQARLVNRCILPAALLAGALIAAAAFWNSGKGAGSAGLSLFRSRDMGSWFITYKRPMAPPGAISVIVTAGHGCVLTVTGPMMGVDLPDRSEIGTYRGALSAEETRSLKDLAAAAVTEAAASRGEASARGTRFLAFGLGETGKELETLVSFPMSKPFPPAIKRFDDAMIAAARKLLAHPHAVLKGAVSCREPVIAPKQELALTLALRNGGAAPIRIHNPAAADDDAGVGVTVLLEKDLPPEKLEDGDLVTVDLKRAEVSQLSAPGGDGAGTPRPVVRLAPGEELVLSVKVRRHLYLSAGSYRAAVFFSGGAEGIPEDEAVEGRLRTPACRFAVRAKR